MKKLMVILLAMGFLSVTACSNTLEGIGKDIENIGKDIQDSGK
ncbi:MAG: entericidin EcnAB [Gammaproteobacteria bacterium]|nr:MAG: entericidin EcnAB [Gammaproteobacteria bacterium]